MGCGSGQRSTHSREVEVGAAGSVGYGALVITGIIPLTYPDALRYGRSGVTGRFVCINHDTLI